MFIWLCAFLRTRTAVCIASGLFSLNISDNIAITAKLNDEIDKFKCDFSYNYDKLLLIQRK